MKRLIFNASAVVSFSSIWLIDRGLTVLVWALSILAGVLRWAISNGSIQIMKRVDPEEYEALQGQYELEKQQTELELLSSVSKLKEHALKIDEWTEEHSEALEAIANALLNECDWDEDHIHQYMKGVVEGIPGLEYLGGPDDEDEDDFDPRDLLE